MYDGGLVQPGGSPWFEGFLGSGDTIASLGNLVQLRALDSRFGSTQSRTVNGTARLIDHSRSGDPRQMQLGRCYSFDGSADRVDMGSTLLGGGVDPFTLSAWIKVASGQSLNQAIMGEYFAAAQKSWLLYISTGDTLTAIITSDGSTNNVLSSGTDVADGTWKHVAFAWSLSGYAFWVNGSVVAQAASPIGTLHVSNQNTGVGFTASSSPTFHFSGEMLDARIFERVLSNAEVTRISSLFPGDADIGPADALFHLKMDEENTATGDLAYDSSGSGNNGTINASTTLADTSQNDIYSFQNELGFSRVLTFDAASTETVVNDQITASDWPITVTMWFKSDLSAIHALCSFADASAADQYFGVAVNTLGRMLIFNSDGSYTDNTSASSAVTADQWHHLAIVWASDTDKRVYVDGTLDQTWTDSEGYPTGIDRFALAHIGDSSPSNYLTGSIDRVKVWERELDTDEIDDDLAGAPVSTTSQIIQWDIAPGDTTELDDTVGTKIGTLSGGTFENFPRDESSPTTSIDSLLLEYSGKCPHDPTVSSPAVTLDGVGDEVVFGNTGLSVVTAKLVVQQLVDNQELFSFQNTAATAVTVVAGVLTFGGSLTVSTILLDGNAVTAAEAGAALNDNARHTLSLIMSAVTASDLRIGSDGTNFGNITVSEFEINGGSDLDAPMAEGTGAVVFDVSGNQWHGVITVNSTEAAIWANQQNSEDALVASGSAIATRYDGSSEKQEGTQIFAPTTLISGACWIYLDADPSSVPIFGEHNATTGNRNWVLLFNATTNNLEFRPSDDGAAATGVVYAPGSAIWTGVWNHVAFTYNAGSIAIYLNGTSVQTGSAETSINTGAANFCIAGVDDDASWFGGMISGLVVEEVEWDASTVSDIHSGIIPATAHHWRDAGTEEYNQGTTDLTASGTPDRIIVPAGILPVTVGPGVLQLGQSLDLGGGQSGSVYARQLADILADLTYDAGDDDEADALFARLLNDPDHEGDDRILTTLPAASGTDLTTLETYTANET